MSYSLDLSKLHPNYPDKLESLSPFSREMVLADYHEEVRIFNEVQKKTQVTAQQISEQQQKINKNYNQLLLQYQEIQLQLVDAQKSHAQEKEEIVRLKNELGRIARIMHDLMHI